MTRHFTLVIFSILIYFGTNACRSQQKNMENKIKFYDCTLEAADWENPMSNNQWIASPPEAVASGLHFTKASLNARNTNELYQTTAQYVFVLGGGDRWVPAENCTGEITGDTLVIMYRPIIRAAPVGEAAPSVICLELNKLTYPDYKKLKITYRQM